VCCTKTMTVKGTPEAQRPPEPPPTPAATALGPRLAEPSYAGWLTVWNQSAKLNPGCPSLRLLHSSVFINIGRRVRAPERERERVSEWLTRRVTLGTDVSVCRKETENLFIQWESSECHNTQHVDVTLRALTRSVYQIWNTGMEIVFLRNLNRWEYFTINQLTREYLHISWKQRRIHTTTSHCYGVVSYKEFHALRPLSDIFCVPI
jgi:hypothetical protein